MKTKKIATRRFKVTAGGKIMRRRSFRRHLKSNKGKLGRRQKEIAMRGSNFRKVKKILGL